MNIELFVYAACRDGWIKTEENHYEKDGFVMSSYDGKDINIWGPDKLQIIVPEVYSMDAIKRALLQCQECGKFVNHIQQVGFAGRCCDNCLESARKKYEYSGWCN